MFGDSAVESVIPRFDCTHASTSFYKADDDLRYRICKRAARVTRRVIRSPDGCVAIVSPI